MRMGEKLPSFTNVKYSETIGQEAIDLYKSTTQSLLEWQEIQINAIMAVNPDGLWTHMVYGLCVSRRNGKGEILAAREFDGIVNLGEKICHTAHRTTTSHDAFNRLYTLLKKAGYEEHSRKQKKMPERSFFASKQYGLEHIEISGGGVIDFRTRTNNGGLGEGFDLLIIDEAQEYTSKQESALIYTVSASKNPQTIMVGTPPTVISGGDVFVRLRDNVIDNKAPDTGWAEWSIDTQTDDVEDVDLWYKYNPSLGSILSERNIRGELAGDQLDFNIQRLGLWIRYNQKSVIIEDDWMSLKAPKKPKLNDKLYLGIKYGRDGANVAMSIASRTLDGKIFVETIDCVSVRAGNRWMFDFMKNPKVKKIAIDGASGQQALADQMRQEGIKQRPILPAVREVILANTMFEQDIYAKNITHSGQESLSQVVTNCGRRPIGTNGGFGYKSLVETYDIAIMDSMILAYWLCATQKETVPQQSISY
ncbi:MAG: hypothetical protein IKT30_06820 [Bacteroidaceae bacterium]|nr:hypothetical protein [Bacteroidaceae bacterium]